MMMMMMMMMEGRIAYTYAPLHNDRTRFAYLSGLRPA